ncbi:hypothetical protein [Paracoccus sp. (in: a-proteobacteria)]|uniref:hypothetical protein n=1 Tax=Paracoccus sp. TaxID=267 RepID=UPI0026E08FE4|nr:hypothetical protein [Paracoccus sp. (in: a-proteobacteria)]
MERDKWLIFGLIVAGLSVGAVLGWLVWNWTGGHPGVSFVAAMFGFGTTYLGTAIAIHKFGPDQAQRNRKGEG